MANTQFTSAADFAENMLKANIGTTIVLKKETPMNVGGRAHNNPYLGRVTELVTIRGVKLGVKYIGEGADTRERKQWAHFRSPKQFVLINNQSGEEYIKLSWTKAMEQYPFFAIKKVYYLDGAPVTKEQFADIQQYFPKRSGDDGNIKVLTPKSADVVRIKQGWRVWEKQGILAA